MWIAICHKYRYRTFDISHSYFFFQSVAFSLISLVSLVLGKPYFYNAHEAPYGYNYAYQQPLQAYAQGISAYSSLVPTYSNELVEDRVAAAYLATPNVLPTLNVLAEVPYSIGKKFTVVPMLLMSKENMNMVPNGEIVKISKDKPVMTIKNSENKPIQCTPAVRIVLEKPISVYSLKTSVLFPSEVRKFLSAIALFKKFNILDICISKRCGKFYLMYWLCVFVTLIPLLSHCMTINTLVSLSDRF